jgi:hypothetical protein
VLVEPRPVTGPSPGTYVVEERGETGRWIERDRFGSYDEAAHAFDRLSVASEVSRIRRLDPRHGLKVVAAVVGAVVMLAVVAWWVAHFLAG